MVRYRIFLKNGKRIEAGDARFSGTFLEHIIMGLHSIQAIPTTDVDRVKLEAISWEGDLRFAGKSDSSFNPTPGSMGELPAGCPS